MRKVLLCINSLRPGGAERQLFLLAKHLPDSWDRQIFTFSGGFFYEELSDLGITISVHSRRHRYDPRPFLHLRNTISSYSPDIVHSWDWMQSIAISRFCKKSNIPHIVGIIRSGRVPPRRWLGMLIASRSGDICIANSNAGLKAFRLQDKGRVVHNGIDLDRIPTNHRSNFICPNSKSSCLMLASFLPSKDHDSLLKAARLLRETINFHLTCSGEGPLLPFYKKRDGDLVESGHVTFSGFSSNVIDLLDSSSIGILVSNASEGLSNSIMEYMAAGLPVICTKTGGNPELVEHGVNGFLVDKGDWKSLAQYVKWLHTNHEKAFEMGCKGREKLLRNFSTGKMVSETTAVYKYLLEKEHCKEGTF